MKATRAVRAAINAAGHAYISRLCRREFSSQAFAPTERSIEYAFVFRHIVACWPRTVLDIGTGTTALPSLIRSCGPVVTATDNIEDYWPEGMTNRHFHVANDDITRTRLTGPFDFITCVSVLEHIQNHHAAIRSMFGLLRPGGHVVLTFPYTEETYVRNTYELPQSFVKEKYAFVTQSYSRAQVERWCVENDASVVEQEYWKFFTGDFWTCGETVEPPRRVGRDELHQMTCLLLRKNIPRGSPNARD